MYLPCNLLKQRCAHWDSTFSGDAKDWLCFLSCLEQTRGIFADWLLSRFVPAVIHISISKKSVWSLWSILMIGFDFCLIPSRNSFLAQHYLKSNQRLPSSRSKYWNLFLTTVAHCTGVCDSAAKAPAANTWVRRQELSQPPCFSLQHLEPLSTYHKFLFLGSYAVFPLSLPFLFSSVLAVEL